MTTHQRKSSPPRAPEPTAAAPIAPAGSEPAPTFAPGFVAPRAREGQPPAGTTIHVAPRPRTSSTAGPSEE